MLQCVEPHLQSLAYSTYITRIVLSYSQSSNPTRCQSPSATSIHLLPFQHTHGKQGYTRPHQRHSQPRTAIDTRPSLQLIPSLTTLPQYQGRAQTFLSVAGPSNMRKLLMLLLTYFSLLSCMRFLCILLVQAFVLSPSHRDIRSC